MLTRARNCLTYANVVATIAVFTALGGVAWAAATINSRLVVNDSLKSADLKNGTGVKDRDVRANSLTGAAIDESLLAEVPSAAEADHAASADDADNAASAGDADTLDGIDSAGFVGGGGRQISVGASLGARSSSYTMLSVSDLIQVNYRCSPDPANVDGWWTIANLDDSGPADVFVNNGSANPSYASQEFNNFNYTYGVERAGDTLMVQFRSPDNELVTLWLSSRQTASGCTLLVHGLRSA